MKKQLLLILLVSLGFGANSQTDLWHRMSVTTSLGIAKYTVDADLPGYYIKLGTQIDLTQNLKLQFSFNHSQVGNFGKRQQFVPNTTDEADYVKQFLGITQEQYLLEGMGSITSCSGDIFSLSLGYEFQFKGGLTFMPKFGIDRIRSRYNSVYLIGARFVNNRLDAGQIGYSLRYGTFWGINGGFEIGFRVNDRLRFLLEIDRVGDRNGTSYINYEAYNFGLGFRQKLGRK